MIKLKDLLDLIDSTRSSENIIQLVSEKDGWDDYTEFYISSVFISPFEDWFVREIEPQGLRIIRVSISKE